MSPIEHPTIIEPAVNIPAAADSSTAATSDKGPTETPPSDGDKNAEGKGPTENAPKDTKTVDPGKDTKDADLTRFDQHPRFQELIKGNKEAQEAIAALKAQNELLAKQVTSATKSSSPDPGQAPARDYGKEVAELAEKAETGDLSMGEILPKLTALIQAQTADQMRKVAQEQEKNMRASTLEQQFLAKNPDFIELVQSGKLNAIKAADPLQDDFTAYQTYKRQEAEASIESKVQEAIERTRKETEAEILRNLKAKGNASVLGEGPTHSPMETKPDVDPRMKNPKLHGGEIGLLARKKAERRAAKGE